MQSSGPQMYELYDPCTVMFFYRYALMFFWAVGFVETFEPRNKHIMIDLGTGNNNKMYESDLPLPSYFLTMLLFLQ